MTGSYFPLALDEEMIWSQLPGRSLPAAAFGLGVCVWHRNYADIAWELVSLNRAWVSALAENTGGSSI